MSKEGAYMKRGRASSCSFFFFSLVPSSPLFLSIEGVYAKLVTTQTRKYRNLVQDEEEMEDNKK